MRNNGQETCAELMEVDVERNQQEKRYQQYAVSRFEQIYNSVQDRLKRMEVSNGKLC